MFQSAKQKRMTYIIFSIYLILLTWLVLFKFATSLSEIPRIRDVNFIPFYYDQETSWHLKEILYNIIVFIPFGVYVQIFKDDWKIAKKCLAALGMSFVFEVVQFTFAIGASDITDIIGNSLGGIVGILFCMMLKKIAPKKYISIINGAGLSVELVGIALMALLLVANH